MPRSETCIAEHGVSQVDLGLEIACLLTPPGVDWSTAELAEVCGCTRQNINFIEHKAMAKLKRRFGPSLKAALNGVR